MKNHQDRIARFIDGDLGEDELADLRRLAKSDKELATVIAEHSSVDALMSVALQDDLSRERWIEATEARSLDADRETFVDGVERGLGRRIGRTRLQWFAAAAVLLLAAVLSWNLLLRPEPVGTIVSRESTDTILNQREETKIFAGEPFRIARGLVQIELEGRGTMILEGPVEIEWTAPMKASLSYGRLHMRVTPSGRGYEVLTPGGRVVDLGTEFGISVDHASGMVETHVLDGEVETSVGSDSPVLLEKDDALRFGTGQSERIPADPGQFYSSLPARSHGEVPHVAWPMDLLDGGICTAIDSGMGGENSDLIAHAAVGSGGPVATTGVQGGAVALDGQGAYLESGFQGIGGTDPRTVTFWLRVPEDLESDEGFAILSWGRFRSPDWGSVWQVSINMLDYDGPRGRLRLGTHGGMAIGTRDLRDGKWHHVAVVLYPALRPDAGKHVLLYVDGEFEPVSQRVLGVIDTEIDPQGHGVWVGRDITHHPADPGRPRYFRGDVDEVEIFGGALSSEQIGRVMTGQSP
ncbi:LamG-like jellyroll fold domain-containing protein [Haloferula rosea]|uniref:FecR domain-containing protein n=1 Tax=Haloferula rosea TaxID=490093 RepID=A0A934RBC5_9BACT|nr:LamG-like jellyroll fold domain-containing protein [Haloferula rosea]MBK1825866.1 FecR domain-containing protein [Haloferula rosea]